MSDVFMSVVRCEFQWHAHNALFGNVPEAKIFSSAWTKVTPNPRDTISSL